MAYQINVRSKLFGVEVIDFTYGNFATKLDAARDISQRVIRIDKSDGDYFSHFTNSIDYNENYYRFEWLHNVDDVNRIAETATMWIAENGHNEENYIEWFIV